MAAKTNPLQVRRVFIARFIAYLVGLHGVFVVATTLLDQFKVHHLLRLSTISIDLPLLIGISLIYLASLLLRKKRRAWLVAVVAYAVILLLAVVPIAQALNDGHMDPDSFVRAIVLPVTILYLLYSVRHEFTVRSDPQAYRSSLRAALIILAVALLYGISGFLLLDKRDFHQEIGVGQAIHRTIDQFDLTTGPAVQPYSKRAHVFVDSLSTISIGAVAYVLVSLFQPLRARFRDRAIDRQHVLKLLDTYGAPSEDFFKLWPHDKQYYFSHDAAAALAYHVTRGVALCVGDPLGSKPAVRQLMQGFDQLCYGNDWLPAFIHTDDRYRRLYEKYGFSMQKIGQEAVVDIAEFQALLPKDKYFRNIRNRFERQGYSSELLQPPHHAAVLARLRTVSSEWLARPGRTERGFMMAYYSDEYMQQCPILVARDAAGTIQGFINQLPAAFDRDEATFDLLRHASASLNNINDFLLMNFITNMQSRGFRRVNLGLAPLVGLDESDEKSTLIDGFLRFAYANGDRFYSFSGLYRFKAKYQPAWSDRYIVYRGGLRGFTRTMNALMRAMHVKLTD